MSDAGPEDIFAQDFLYRGSDLTNFILAMLKGGLTKQARDQVGDVAARYVRRATERHGLTVDTLLLDETGRNAVAALQSTGYAIVPDIFSATEIADIKDYVKDKDVTYYLNGVDGANGQRQAKLEQVPPENRLIHYLQDDIHRCPALYRAAHRPDLIHIAAQYLGTPPTISTMSLWWSFPSKLAEFGAQQFHHDRGDFRSCNLFVYLTDVTTNSGPHAFVKHTHTFPQLLNWSAKHFANDQKRFNTFWQWMENHRKTDAEVRAFFPAQEIQIFTGSAGTNFFEDTRGLHRAVPPVDAPRFIFEIVYTTLPKYNENPRPVPRRNMTIPGLDTQSAIEPLVRYATRLHYT